MALIIRIDVDRGYGKHPFLRHIMSRAASDLWLPTIEAAGYLNELKAMLGLLAKNRARAYVFFRRCTAPTENLMTLLENGGHQVGLHLENSRSRESFEKEKERLEALVGQKVCAFSKHGCGREKYGLTHYAPYRPLDYLEWARHSGMRVLLGNLQDPRMLAESHGDLIYFPSAFWLEPFWRQTEKFTINWLKTEVKRRDVVMLVHPENVLESASLTSEFIDIIQSLETRIL